MSNQYLNRLRNALTTLVSDLTHELSELERSDDDRENYDCCSAMGDELPIRWFNGAHLQFKNANGVWVDVPSVTTNCHKE